LISFYCVCGFVFLCTRTDLLIDADYFMAVAVLSAKRSKDPNTQVGACLVDQDNKIIGTGHNCMPNGGDGKLPWNRDGDKLDTKYMYVCHAELNAIVNASAKADVKGCTMYVTLFPCNECTKLIIQAGLKEVVYLCDKYYDTPETIASKRMLDMAGIPYSLVDLHWINVSVSFCPFLPKLQLFSFFLLLDLENYFI
uniref:Deoxycytidylate deaminase n=1 Tax=Oreochromis niloticus TaxID=8128 RepID=I3KW18_ORENI